MTALLGIDYGSKFIGLSIGDSETQVAVPFRTISNASNVPLQIERICTTNHILTIVLGMPRSFDHSHTNQGMQSVVEFSNQLEKISGVSIQFETEIFTSKMAQSLPSTSAGDTVHSKSAMLILQTYIDRTYGTPKHSF